jgi:hypothetical protein
LPNEEAVMSISGMKGSNALPPSLQLRSAGQQFDLKLVAPKLLPLGEVVGFAQTDTYLSQEQVDRAITRLQAFVADAPDDDQVVYAALLAQAADSADANWPVD